jgi:septal ring-binding cell division protein DamX
METMEHMDTKTDLKIEPDSAHKQVAEENTEERKSSTARNRIIHTGKLPLCSLKRSHTGFLSVLILLASVLLVVYFRPAIYYESLIRSGNITYSAKTNRITGEKHYYYENAWHKNPIPTAKPYKSPITVSIASPSPEKTVHEDISLPPEETANAEKVEKYAIQVKAFQDFKDVDELSDSLKKRGFDVGWKKVEIKNKGTWYRVLIGRFADPSQAAQYMKKNNIEASYPGSFIRKLSVESEQS